MKEICRANIEKTRGISNTGKWARSNHAREVSLFSLFVKLSALVVKQSGN
jgi:hypothetical protein